MSLVQALDLRQQQTQRITPRQIIASEILAWTGTEVEAAIERESAENPALERRDDGMSAVAPEPLPSLPRHDVAPRAKWVGEDDSPPFDQLSGMVTLRDHLRDQIGLAANSATANGDHSLRPIVAYLIECLDDRGYLAVDTAEIAENFGVRRHEVERAIWILQTMEPAGVGARSLRECLCLQAEQLRQSGELPPLIYSILVDCWEDLVSRRDDRIARRLGAPIADVRAAVTGLQHMLTPNPGAAFRPIGGTRSGLGATNAGMPAIRPDIVFERTPEGLTGTLPRLYDDALVILPVWRTLAERAPRPVVSSGTALAAAEEGVHRYAREQVERAETFLSGLARRSVTLKRIANALIEQQAGFLETGNRAFLRPLTRHALAKILHLDESVVSRAVADKWARLPGGELVALSAFFGGAHAVRDALAHLIATENPANPLSDEELVTLLAAQGFDIARRTVAKYRGLEKILPARLRRRDNPRDDSADSAAKRQEHLVASV